MVYSRTIRLLPTTSAGVPYNWYTCFQQLMICNWQDFRLHSVWYHVGWNCQFSVTDCHDWQALMMRNFHLLSDIITRSRCRTSNLLPSGYRCDCAEQNANQNVNCCHCVCWLKYISAYIAMSSVFCTSMSKSVMCYTLLAKQGKLIICGTIQEKVLFICFYSFWEKCLWYQGVYFDKYF